MDAILKQQLLDKIAAIDDDELLLMVKEDIELYETIKTGDVTDTLTTAELDELKDDLNIPAEEESVSLEEFQQSIGRWLTK